MNYTEKRQYNALNDRLKTLLGHLNHNKKVIAGDKEYIDGFEHVTQSKAELINDDKILKAKEDLLWAIDLITLGIGELND
tara:strand:+ start:2338 stop:2577 length:240 start_codon:yes stop_codon:yes gene_type:complete